MSSFGLPGYGWKNFLKNSRSADVQPHPASSKREPAERKPPTATSRKTTIQDKSPTVKVKCNNGSPTSRIKNQPREEYRFTGGHVLTNRNNKQRSQQTATQRSSRVTARDPSVKMSSLPSSRPPKGACQCLTSTQLRNEVVKKTLQTYKLVVSKSRSSFTTLPKHLYKGSKLPIANIQLGRSVPAATERVETKPWIRKAEKNKILKPKLNPPNLTNNYPSQSKIPHPLKQRPFRPLKETIKMNTVTLKRVLSDDILYQFGQTNVRLDVNVPLPELSLMNQKLSQLRCVLATLKGTVNTMGKSIDEFYPLGQINQIEMQSRNGLKSNFESIGRAFKTVNNTLLQLKDLNMRALGFCTPVKTPNRDKTFLVNKEKSGSTMPVSDTTEQDSEMLEKGLDVIKTALEITLSKNEDITVEEVRDEIVNAQIDLLDNAVMSPVMTITDQLKHTDETKAMAVQEAEDFIRDRQNMNPNQKIEEVVDEIESNQLRNKASDLVMAVLDKALQENPSQTISRINPEDFEKTELNISELTVPIMEEVFDKEGNVSIFELVLSLQEASNILDAIDPCPSITMANFLNDVLASGSFKMAIINKCIKDYPKLTVGTMQENLKAVQRIFHNAELHPESTNITHLLKIECLSENSLVGKILRREASFNPNRTILSLESKVSDVAHTLKEVAPPKTKLHHLPMLIEEHRTEKDAMLHAFENVSETLRASVDASENVTDVVMEAVVEASLKENPVISMAETKDNISRAQLFLAVTTPSLSAKISDLGCPDLSDSCVIPRVINKAIAVRENITVSELHQSFEEVKERIGKAAVAPHLIRLFYMLNEPNRLHLSPKCALLKDAILTSSAPLGLYWKNYYAEKVVQVAKCSCPDPTKLKVKIMKNAIDKFKGRECHTGVLIKMVKKWRNVLENIQQDQLALSILPSKWISLSGLSQSIIEEIACRYPMRRVGGLLSDVSRFVEQLNSRDQIGNTVGNFKTRPFENDPECESFQEIASEIVNVARLVDRDMPVKQLSRKMENLKESLEEFLESSADVTVTDVIEEGRLQEEIRNCVIDVAASIHPSITAWQMQTCLSEIQNDLENVAVIPNQIAISSLYVDDPVLCEELVVYAKNEIINEAVRHDPNMTFEDLREAISETHKRLMAYKSTCSCPNQDLQPPNNFVTRALQGCVACAEGSLCDMVELLGKVGKNLLSTNSIRPNRTVQEEQQNRLEKELETREFNPFNVAYLANQYPPIRHAMVASIVLKPLYPHALRPFMPNFLKNNMMEMVPNETPVDFNGREDAEFDFLDLDLKPYSYYDKQEYAHRRSEEDGVKVLFYEK